MPTGTASLRRRKVLGLELYHRFDGEVQRGPLKGFRLSGDSTWAAPDLGPMLLGTYESNVVERLSTLKAKTLIDVGAADGYFGVGLVKCGWFEESICFEMDPISRAALAQVAQSNEVSDRITVLGAAGPSFVDVPEVHAVAKADAVFLLDIEGAEFDLLRPDVFPSMFPAHVIIELHDDLSRGQNRRGELERAAADYFEVEYIHYGARNPMSDPLLAGYSEDDRWLLTSEGRMFEQAWMVLSPRSTPLSER